jgi:hypothetical protein
MLQRDSAKSRSNTILEIGSNGRLIEPLKLYNLQPLLRDELRLQMPEREVRIRSVDSSTSTTASPHDRIRVSDRHGFLPD